MEVENETPAVTSVKVDADMENHVTEEEITSKDLDDDSSESTGGDEDSATDDTKDTTEGDVEPSE